MRYCALKKGSPVLYACSKNHYVKKERKVIRRTPKGYISPIWGEAPSNPIVTKCGLWDPLPDLINCAKFIFIALMVFG